eukprot:650646_1
MSFKHLLTFTITIHILFQPNMSSNPLCDTSEQCRSSVVSCVEGEDCFVDCIAYRACYNATIECPSNSHNCRIYCAFRDACKYATINSSSSNGNLTLVGGPRSWQFQLTKIYCPNGGSCSVNCASTVSVFGSCQAMTVYGQHAKRVYIDSGNGGLYGLALAKIYCPHNSNRTECTIVVQNTSDSGQMAAMQIYAIGSLNDVSVTCKPTTTMYCYSWNYPPIMHYTLNYSRSCTMDLIGQDQWNCFDPRTTYPTLEPTALPSVAPSGVSLHPSAAPSSSPTQAPSTAPTGPSAQPTTRTPTEPTNTPTKAPTYAAPVITNCTKGTERVCYYVDIHPLPDVVQSRLISIQDIYHGSNDTYYDIYVTPTSNQCVDPSITLTSEQIDYDMRPSLDEGLHVITPDGTTIETCTSGNQNLGITKLAADESNLLVTLKVDFGVDDLCGEPWPYYYAINAQLTIFCSDSTAPPTNDPTSEPSHPTINPTIHPTDDPTNEPTLHPTRKPTNDPTDDPTIDPTSYPSTDPTHDPTNDPTVEPTLGPTKRPTPAPIACPYNTFSFSDSLSCFDCDDNADGYECKGQNILTVQSGFWLSAVPNARKAFDEFISLDDKRFDAINYSLVSLRCPSGQCCDENDGCSYYDLNSDNVRRSNTLCAKGRNISSITCSECNDGLYPLIGTRICDRCDHTQYPLLCIPLVLSFVFVICMVFVFSKPANPLFAEKEIDWRRLFMRDESAIINILLFKITLYFYQSLSQILFTKNITPATHIERALLSIGNFDIFSSSSGGSGFCVIGQIQSGLHQLLISQIFYGFLIVDLLIILIMSRIYNASLYSFCCCFACCLSKSRLQSYKAFIKTGAINILMMCAGPILSLCFKLLTPINIGDYHHPQYYHFYDATKPCYRFIWFAAFICISFICIVMFILWYSVRQQTPEQRGDASNEYRSLINKYASRAWYWEFVLFARRFIIAIFTAIETNAMTSAVLGLCIMMLLMAHARFNPFRYDRANFVEALCLLSLGSVILCLNMPVTGIYVKAMSIYVSVLILMPIVVILLLCVRILYRLCKFKITNNADISFSKEMVAIEKIITRMPTKHRTSFKEDIQIQLQQTTHKKDTTKSKPDVEGEGDSYTLTHDHVLAAFDIEKKTSIEILPPEDSYQNESVSSIEVKYQ